MLSVSCDDKMHGCYDAVFGRLDQFVVSDDTRRYSSGCAESPSSFQLSNTRRWINRRSRDASSSLGLTAPLAHHLHLGIPAFCMQEDLPCEVVLLLTRQALSTSTQRGNLLARLIRCCDGDGLLVPNQGYQSHKRFSWRRLRDQDNSFPFFNCTPVVPIIGKTGNKCRP
jgi:hypothetical protein